MNYQDRFSLLARELRLLAACEATDPDRLLALAQYFEALASQPDGDVVLPSLQTH